MSVTLEKAVIFYWCSQAFGSLEEACSEEQALDVPPGERQDWLRVHDSLVHRDEVQNLDGEEER